MLISEVVVGKKVKLLPNSKKLRERIAQYGEIYVVQNVLNENAIFLRSVETKSYDLRWVTVQDIELV